MVLIWGYLLLTLSALLFIKILIYISVCNVCLFEYNGEIKCISCFGDFVYYLYLYNVRQKLTKNTIKQQYVAFYIQFLKNTIITVLHYNNLNMCRPRPVEIFKNDNMTRFCGLLTWCSKRPDRNQKYLFTFTTVSNALLFNTALFRSNF